MKVCYPRRRRDPLERFWEKTEPRGSCLIWCRAHNSAGYPEFHFDGRPWLAHIWILWYTGRRIRPGYEVHHVCREPSCVNPGHLRVTRAERHWRFKKRRRAA